MRLYPPKPKVGFRATAPSEAWHIDATIIKLLDGTKACLHAVIDNYSRKILAWTVAERLNPMNTCLVLNQAAACLIESWWRSLRHGWLFISHLDNVVTARQFPMSLPARDKRPGEAA